MLTYLLNLLFKWRDPNLDSTVNMMRRAIAESMKSERPQDSEAVEA